MSSGSLSGEPSNGEQVGRTELKIVLITTLYAPNLVGGTESSVQTLAEGLTEAGQQVVVISTAPHKDTSIGYIAGVKVYYVGLKNLYWPYGDNENPQALKMLSHALDTCNPWMAREVGRILDAERPDLVHTNGLSGFSVLTWRSVKHRQLPLVHTLHDHYLLCPRSTMFRNGRNCERRCVECLPYALPRYRLSNLVEAVVGVSHFILERHLEFGYFKAVSLKRVIPNSYAPEWPTHPPRAAERSPPVRFGYLGQLNASKGIETLLSNVLRLREGTWSLTIAGRGPSAYESHLRAKYGVQAIEFLGHTSPAALFSEIDVLVVPSLLRESFGRVVIEAFAHGIPVIGSDRGGIPELIEEGRTGFLFDPDLDGDLLEKAGKFIDRPPLIDDMRIACLEKAENFLPQKVTDHYIDLYDRTVEKVRHPSALRG